MAAISVGIVGGRPVLDLDYVEDSTAEVDMNVVMTGAGAFVEVQGTAEQTPVHQGAPRRAAGAGRGRHRRGWSTLQRRALAARGDKQSSL